MRERNNTHKSVFGLINIALVLAILLINAYILLDPFLPKLKLFYRKKQFASVQNIPYKTNLKGSESVNNKRKDVPKDMRVVIPSIALDEHIYEGTNPRIIDKGVWARPQGSTPDQGSNTVLVGHRFNYSKAASFYNLDKVKVGDYILVYWHEKEYNYQVTSTFVVAPTEVSVEAPSVAPQVTLYTCTPLWTAKDRLVLKATLINPEVLQNEKDQL